MKRIFFSAALVLGLAIATATPGLAQEVTAITASVPFAFTVGLATLPAGRYVFEKKPDMNGNVLEVRSEDGRNYTLAIMTLGSTVDPANQSELVFRKVGGRDFLERVDISGLTENFQLERTRSEQQLVRQEGEGTLHSHPALHPKS